MRTKENNATAPPAESHPPVPFSVFAECMETLTDMLCSSDGDVESPECHAVGAFILNHGSREEGAEALLAVMPIATRVYRRWDSAAQASLAKSCAAVKGKKK